MSWRSLPSDLKEWEGKLVLVRVDWNISLESAMDPESMLKIQRSVPLLHCLQTAGARVVLLTHLGRPTTACESEYSTERLLPFLKAQHLMVEWVKGDALQEKERVSMQARIAESRPGTLFLLENTRFYPGEEKNTVACAKAFASFGEVFINEAFAACHRAHASVVGVASLLPAYAGPALQEEVERLHVFRDAPKRPSLAFLGGKKISTKLEVIEVLQKRVQEVYLGGAMAVTCEAARGQMIGASYIESGQKAAALKLLKHKNVHLPLDYVVAKRIEPGVATRITDLSDLRKEEIVVDVGPQTLAMWAQSIRVAASILWNGPMGITEIDTFAAGSRGLARYLGFIPHKAQVVVGGGDTIPVLHQASVMDRISFVSTGGGAMLDFLVQGEKMVGLKGLVKKAK